MRHRSPSRGQACAANGQYGSAPAFVMYARPPDRLFEGLGNPPSQPIPQRRTRRQSLRLSDSSPTQRYVGIKANALESLWKTATRPWSRQKSPGPSASLQSLQGARRERFVRWPSFRCGWSASVARENWRRQMALFLEGLQGPPSPRHPEFAASPRHRVVDGDVRHAPFASTSASIRPADRRHDSEPCC